MNDRLFDLYDQLDSQRILLCFKGGLTLGLMDAILGLVENKLELLEPNARMRRRVFQVLMESLQNQYHHGQAGEAPGGNANDAPTHDCTGLVLITQLDAGYSVATGNALAAASVDALRQRLDRVNNCNPDELRKLYLDTLSDGRFTARGGGGLGIIDMARRSGRRLEFNFIPLDRDRTFFSLNVNVAPETNTP